MTVLSVIGISAYSLITVLIFIMNLYDYISLSNDVKRGTRQETKPGYLYLKRTVKVNRKESLEDMDLSMRWMKFCYVWPVILISNLIKSVTGASEVHKKLYRDLTKEELDKLLAEFERRKK